MIVVNVERIESSIDKTIAGETPVEKRATGVILVQNLGQVMQFANMMATGGIAVGPHLQGKPGVCLAIALQALEWEMNPYGVASKSYEVNGRLAFESQLIHAVIEARAPLRKRLRPEYKGHGKDRICTINGFIKGEDEPLHYESPTVEKAKKKSPLWTEDPDQQLFYYASRAWARRYFPDILLGVYTREEAEEIAPNAPVTDKPTMTVERLRGQGDPNRANGFSRDNVRALEAPRDQPLAMNVAPTQEKEPVAINATPEQSSTTSPPDETKTTDNSAGDDGVPQASESSAETPAHDPETGEIHEDPPPRRETTMARGQRLLAGQKTAADVVDLFKSIDDELMSKQTKGKWKDACRAHCEKLEVDVPEELKP